MIRVCLVDDHDLVRAGLKSLLDLAADVEVVAEAADGAAALEAVRASRPDIVLLDVRLPRIDGLGVLRALRREGFGGAVVLLTTFDEDEVLEAGLAAGARGYLLKDASFDDLLAALREVAGGGTYVHAGARERILGGLERLGGPAGKEGRTRDDLTDREIEVLRFVARGFSNAEIARILDVAEGTVKNHVSSLLSKLGVRDRTRAALAALSRGLI